MDLMADGGRSDKQLFCGFRKTHMPGGGFKGAQRAQRGQAIIHR
jgi:hypothetical protein